MPWSGDIFSGQDVLTGADAPLVGPDDFAEWFSIVAPSNDELNRIQTACEIASADCRAETNQQLSVSTDTVTINQRGGSREIILPQWPVTAILSLIIDGNALTETTDYVWSQTGVISPVIQSMLFSCWREWRQVVVTYTHGWSPLPRDIAGVCLARAKRLYDAPNAQIVEKETLGTWSVTYAPLMDGLTEAEKYTLARYASWTNGY